MVRIRLKRMGRRHRPFYRINAIEKRAPRDGRIIEQLGWYDPLEKDEAKAVNLDDDRVRHWLSAGAQPSDTVMDILAKRGIVDADAWKAKRHARVAKKIELQAKAKVEADAKAKTDAEAAAKAEAAKQAAAAEAEKSE